MKSNYEISIVCNDLFKNESLFQAISNLEKLEQITLDVFNRINKSLIDKKTKLENLKSRINRANIIVSNFENLPQALTLKSKRFYPSNVSSYENTHDGSENPPRTYLNSPYTYQSIYYDDVCDFALVKIPSTKNHQDINTKPSNPSSKLGKTPDGMLEDVTLYQEILNSFKEYKEITNDTKFSSKTPITKPLDSHTIPPDTERMNSVFQFIEKTKVYGDKKNMHYEPRDSKLINNFLKKKDQLHSAKKPQEAPVSITEKVKLTKYKQKKDLIRRNTNTNIQLNIPKNINLPLISDFDIETSPLEDYFAENQENEVYAPQETIFNDDINEFHTPLDIIKNYNKKQSQLFTQENFAKKNEPAVTTNINNTRTATARETLNNPQESNQTITYPNQQNQINQNNQNLSTPSVTVKIQPVVNPPNIQSIPVSVSVPDQSKSKIPPVPKIPLPPPIAKLPIPPPKKNSEIKTSTEIKPVQAKTMYEEIACDNPMARLKKIGSVTVNNTKDDKKQDSTAQRQSSMVNLFIKKI